MNKALYYIQLALRMGKASFGSRLIPSIQKGECRLVVISSLLGANQKKKLTNKSSSYQIPLVELDADLFNKISQSPNMAYGILDAKLADEILGCL